ncbi:unnamed protein product [Ceutorhynchus assimilis]|uniref:Nbr1 FW domain-containing protein n=1 Tax=Ceutorhynchus assimilis TaxID=467358 RepID=A0A9P0GSV4_9CUCU|nr:unnamed protein product [Ceutorhynchus assimilis]
MSFKTKDLEIVYSLRWKNLPKRDDKKQMMSIVAVYDIPATTLNFAVFKSYLLKNSGIAEDDVNVYYIMDNGKEYPIQSQTDFQVALYAFRRKARVGEVINLLLERISDQTAQKMHKHSNDVETQFDLEPTSISSTCCAGNTAPEWFLAGLVQLKKELMEEISANVSTVMAQTVADLKSSCPYRIKSKLEKRPKKVSSHGTANVFDTKTLMRSLRYDTKLDKLERKATKYREKRSALQHREGEAGCSNARKLSALTAKQRLLQEEKRQIEEDLEKSDEETVMDAKPLTVQTTIPHMLGGEHYIHEWMVENTGQDQWTSLTSLQYSWGSKALVALKKTIAVPLLKPGEKGLISVAFYIPEQPGQYESYWQFMHKGRRFGHWLGVRFIVDPFDLKIPADKENTVQFKTSEARNSAEALKPYYDSMDMIAKQEKILKNAADDLAAFLSTEDEDQVKHSFTSSAEDSDCSWTSETQRRLVAKVDMQIDVPIPQCFVVDSPEKLEPTPSTSAIKKSDSFDDNNNNDSASGCTIKITDDELENMVFVTFPKDEYAKGGFINVHVDGQKVLIPVNLLNSELVDAAQKLNEAKSPTPPKNDPDSVPKTLEEPIIPVQIANNDNNVAVDLSTPAKNVPEPEENVEQRSNYFEANNYMSHCSAAGSCFSEVNAPIDQQHRIFVFPQDNPGYEMVYPVLDLNNPEQPTLIERPAEQVLVPQQVTVNPFVEAVPNFQQLPREIPHNAITEPALAASALLSSLGITPGVSTPIVFQQKQPQPTRVAPTLEATASAATAPAASVPAATVPAASVPAATVPAATAPAATSQSPGRWVNGHWVSANPQSPREANLQALAEMGFWNRDLNATLLARFNDDLNRVVAELVQ